MLQISLNKQIIKARSSCLKLFQRRKFLRNLWFQKKWSLHLWKVFQQSRKCSYSVSLYLSPCSSWFLQCSSFSSSFLFLKKNNNQSSLTDFLCFCSFYSSDSWVLLSLSLINFMHSWINVVFFVSPTYVFLHFPKLKNSKFYWLADINIRTHLRLKCWELAIESFVISLEQQYFSQCYKHQKISPVFLLYY